MYHICACLCSKIVELAGRNPIMDSLLDFVNNDIKIYILEIETKGEPFKSLAYNGDVQRLKSTIARNNVQGLALQRGHLNIIC